MPEGFVAGGKYAVVGPGGAAAGRVAVVGGGGGGFSFGDWLFGLFYQRYQEGSNEAITYTGAGRGDMESRLVEVSPGQGDYSKVSTPTYGYRPRWGLICCILFPLLLLPLLFICQVRAVFTGESCGTFTDECADRCGTLGLASLMSNKDFCCASCPLQMPSTGLQCAQAPPQVHEVVRRHYGTVYRQIPENHYVHVQMPEKPPVVHTVKVMAPAKQYDCAAQGPHPEYSWSPEHTRWCCYKYKMYCPHRVVDKQIYHTVTKVQNVRVPVPEPMPTNPPIVHTIHHSYHVPSPPQYVHVDVPGPTVTKPVVVNDRVPYPVREPPQVINVKKPYPVHIKGPDHYVKVPVPSPPHVVTHYHTQWNTVVDSTYDCNSGVQSWHSLWSHAKQTYCCSHANDCHAGFSNWYHGWSSAKKSWCCAHKNMGCPGTWHGHWHAHAVKIVHEVHGVGHGGYDCNAGASNWMQGWSPKKKDYCCAHGGNQYCVKFHCHADQANVASWGQEQRDFCCKSFQLGCPHTTLSPLGCDAQCEINGEMRTCQQRIDWTQENVFGSKSNACNLAYSKVQVECDVCRACSIEAAGCGEQGPGKAAFDCEAALGNWCRAWSAPKKVWCCKEKGKGCQSPDTPPHCDAGAGKVWKKVFISGHWSWEAQMAHGAVSVVNKPYACHAGLPGWKTGWSAAKKTWCCSHEQLGCPGYVYHGAHTGGSTKVVVTKHYVSGSAGGAAGGAVAGGSWSSSHSYSSGGSYSHSSGGHIVVHHHHVVH